MDAIANGTIAYVASLTTVFGLYPYRDYVKSFSPRHIQKIDARDFCLSRYRGMMCNPMQPMLIASPQGLLYFGYVLGAGGVTGATLGGFLAGNAKAGVSTIARRMSVGSRYSRLDHMTYKSLADCVLDSGRQYGALSFFTGGVAASVIATLWHGIALAVLQQSVDQGFVACSWDAFRIHALMTLLTAPIRNAFRSAMTPQERSGGVRGLAAYAAGEAAVFREAGGVSRSMARTEGIPFFFHGVMRTTLKTSLPFGLTYGLFKTLNGSIGHPSGGHHHSSNGPRHFSRRF